MISLLKDRKSYFTDPFDKIVWCCGVDTENRDIVKIKNVKILKGFPSEAIDNDKLFNRKKNNCLIVDDLMEECGNDPALGRLFTNVRIGFLF